MANQKRIQSNKSRKMMGETTVKKPFRTRANKQRIEWVWKDDMMVPIRVRKG